LVGVSYSQDIFYDYKEIPLNITDLLLDKSNADAISEFAKKFNVDDSQAKDAISSLANSLSQGLGYHTKKDSGLGGLFDALKTGKHSRYLDNPSLIEQEDTVKDGNDILGHIFGNKDVSRHVAKRAAKKTGLSDSLLKKMLPIVATMVMGALSKGMFGGSAKPQRQESTSFLTKIFDKDGDGSMVDDMLGMAFKAVFR